jgi:DNA-binding LacI/PurR family transcriptional regulator
MKTKVGREEVARVTGVSESTVSRALNDSPRISEEVKSRVKAKAAELGYCPSRPATQFAMGKSYSVGLVVPYYEKILPFTRSYFPSLLDGILLGTMNAGYTVGIVMDNKLGRY